MMQAVGLGLLFLLFAACCYFFVLAFGARDRSLSPLVAVLMTGVYTLSFMTMLLFGEWRDGPTPATLPLSLVAIFYLGYAAGVIATMHAFLWAFATYRAAKMRPISKNYPRYLDYAYAAVMLIGLGQIFVSGTELARYYHSRLESEHDIVRNIKTLAQATVDRDCQVRNQYFTEDYCDKMSTIAATPDDRLKALVLSRFIADRAFMTHIVGTDTAMAFSKAGSTIREVKLRNPLAEPIALLKVRVDYENMKASEDGKATIGWIGLLLLPWGIGLRVVKTSMELFVPMADPPPLA